MTEHDMKLPDAVLALKLLDGASLSQEERQLALVVGNALKFVTMKFSLNKTNDLILNLTPENVTQHSRIVTTTCKGSSTPTKMSKIIGTQIH